jgi:hypothetical protein
MQVVASIASPLSARLRSLLVQLAAVRPPQQGGLRGVLLVRKSRCDQRWREGRSGCELDLAFFGGASLLVHLFSHEPFRAVSDAFARKVALTLQCTT